MTDEKALEQFRMAARRLATARFNLILVEREYKTACDSGVLSMEIRARLKAAESNVEGACVEALLIESQLQKRDEDEAKEDATEAAERRLERAAERTKT